MKVFMLGWEFPPFISGGLGTACHGLTKAMSKIGIEVVFVLQTCLLLEVVVRPPPKRGHLTFRQVRKNVEFLENNTIADKILSFI